MKTVLVINSQAASSQIGGSGGGFALQRMGVQVFHLPTLLVGRHPGWGDPGQVNISADDLATLFIAVREQGLLPKIDGILTGYFRSVRQITAACAIIDQVREENPNVLVAVDPVMGDYPTGQYVSEAVAQAIRRELVPMADHITPNRWEMELLSDRTLFDDASVIAAATSLSPEWVFLSDAPAPDNWVHMAVHQDECWKVECPKLTHAPKGTGDLLAALILGQRLQGLSPRNAFEAAINSVQDILAEAQRLQTKELPLVQAQDRMITPRSSLTARPPEIQAKQSKWVAGIGSCKDGWLAVLLDVTGQKTPLMRPLLSFWDVLNFSEQPEKIAVDLPIGFSDSAAIEGRKCEKEVRKLLGPRQHSVISSPCRAALLKTRYEDANHANIASAKTSPKLSSHAFELFAKLREIDTRITPKLQNRVFETHPDLAFTIVRNQSPCKYPKEDEKGVEERIAELRSIGFNDEFLNQTLPSNINAERADLLGACICAWVAQRALLGAAKSYPTKPEKDRRGLEMVIRV